MRRNLLKNIKKMRISFQPVDNPDKVNTHLLSWLLAACSMIGPFATDMYLPSFHQMAQAFGSDLASVQMRDEGTKNGPDRSALLGHNFVYQETKPHGFYSSYFHQRISS